MAARREGCVPVRRLQRLAAHAVTAEKGRLRRVERLFAGRDLWGTPGTRFEGQNAGAWRQRLARTHSVVHPAGRAGRTYQRLHGAIMGSRRAVRLARRFVRYRLRRQSADLRVPCRDGPGKGRSRHILRIYQNDPAAYQKSGLQHDSIDGGRRTPLLRQFRIPCQQFFRPVVALRHSGRTESPGAQGACDGVGGDYGSGRIT